MNTSERHQKALLGGLERFIGVDHPQLIPAVPKILMAFYQADALEEEVIKQWGTHVSKKYVDRETSKKVRKASEPFLKVNFVLTSFRDYMLTIQNPPSGLRKQKMRMTRKRTMRMARASDASTLTCCVSFSAGRPRPRRH